MQYILELKNNLCLGWSSNKTNNIRVKQVYAENNKYKITGLDKRITFSSWVKSASAASSACATVQFRNSPAVPIMVFHLNKADNCHCPF